MSERTTLTEIEVTACKGKLEMIQRLYESGADHAAILKSLNELETLLAGGDHSKGEFISAQLSLYPLRQASLSQAIDPALKKLKEYELEFYPGSMSAVIFGVDSEVWRGLQAAFLAASEQAEVVMVVTISNACPQPEREEGA